jgi:membrane-associated phospholipid phosphatase
MRTVLRALPLIAAAVAAAGVAVAQPSPSSRGEGWLLMSYGDVEAPKPSVGPQEALAALRKITARRTASDVARFEWWAVGGPAYRWNEIILAEMQEDFVTLPLAARHLALFHVALDDAIAAARHHRKDAEGGNNSGLDSALTAGGQRSAAVVQPSEHAAAAAAAADLLAYLFPARAGRFAAKAEEAMQVRLLAGVEFPHEVAAGRAIGTKVAALAIARGKSDGSDAKWSGAVPEGPGLWKGKAPGGGPAGTWQSWVLARADEFRPGLPPAFDSDATRAALAELKAYRRTPKSNHRAIFWEVNGGARAHTLWNEIARTKLLEYGNGATSAARILAALNVAIVDAGIACWDAKLTYWYIRPAQLDPEVKPVFAAPGHPSFPSAHGCFSTAAATVLADAFPRDREELLALGREAAEARIWAGIHYRFDIEAGEEIGRKVGQKTLTRAFGPRAH